MMEHNDIRAILESILFVSPVPVKLETFMEILPESGKEAIMEQLLRLKEECEPASRGIDLLEVGGGYQYRTKPQWAERVSRLKKTKALRLSQSALETLAIVAYRQPVIRPEIENIRGVDSGWILRSLMEKGLIKMAGRKDLPGRPIIYGTSKAFLEVFNLNSLSDLPRLKEIQPPPEVESGLNTESLVGKIENEMEVEAGPGGRGELEMLEPARDRLEIRENEPTIETTNGRNVDLQGKEGTVDESAFHQAPPQPLEE